MKEQKSDKTLLPTKGLGTLLKKVVVVLLVCQLCQKQEVAGGWPHTHITVEIIRIRPIFLSICLCVFVNGCVYYPPWSSGTRQHIFSRDSWAMAQKLCYWWMSTSLGGLDQGPLGTIGCIAGEPHHESNLPKVAKEE